MATPSYSTDLQDITLAESITNWSALGGGAAGLGAGLDFAMQGTNCVDKQVTAAEKGQIYNFGTTIPTGVVDRHFLVWVFLATPGLTNTLQNRGLGIVIGTGGATPAYTTFHVEGADTYGSAGRVGKCYPIQYKTSSNVTPPYRTLTNTPPSNPSFFGSTANITGAVKSANLGVDAIRYGSSLSLTDGDSSTPATITGASYVDNLRQNRWGILNSIGGVFELQGKLKIGQNTGSIPVPTYFESSNQTISIIDTPHTTSDFTQIIIDHPSTFFKITNLSFLSLGTNNPGQFLFKNNNTTGIIVNSSFSNFGITNLGTNVICTGNTWRSSESVTQSGALLNQCIFDNSKATSALISNNPQNITNCEFYSRGTGHAIEIVQSGSYIFNGNVFSNYSSVTGILGTEAIYNNSNGLVTLNVVDALSPSYRNGPGATTTVNNNVAVTLIGMKDDTEVRVYQAGTITEVDGIETATDGSPNNRSWAFSTTAGQSVDIIVFNTGYQYVRYNSYLVPGSATSLPISQFIDRVYTNP